MGIVTVVRCNTCGNDIVKENKFSVSIISSDKFNIIFGLDSRSQVTDQNDRLDFCDKNCLVRYFDGLMEQFKLVPIPRKA